MRYLLTFPLLLALLGCGEPASPGAGQPTASPTTEAALAPDCEDVAFAQPRDDAGADPRAGDPAPEDVVESVRSYGFDEAPEHFADLWLDGGSLVVAFTDELDRHAEALAERTGDAPLRLAEVEHSLVELEEVRDGVGELDDDVLGNAILQGWGVDVRRNRVSLMVIALDDEARARISARLGAERICFEHQPGPGRDVEPGSGVDGVLQVPTSEAANIQQALMAGVVLRGDAEVDGGCVWVEGPDGERIPVVWPPGFGARFTEAGVELVDEDGAVVAREGDVLEMGGGNNPVSGERCMFGEDSAWVAGSVSVAREAD